MLPGLESYMHSSELNNRTVSEFCEYLFWFLNLFPNRLWSKLKPEFKFLRYFAKYLVHTDHVTFDDTLIYCKNMTSKYERIKSECKRKNILWEDPDFQAIQSSVFYYQTPPFTFQWKRISEIVQTPLFINDGEQFDIIPGKMGKFLNTFFPFRTTRRLTISIQNTGWASKK